MTKTPHTAFRFSNETREQLAQVAEQFASMTEAVKKMIEATAAFAELNEGKADRFPFEAYTAAGMAFRKRMGYQPGEILPQDALNAVDAALVAANPIIREDQHYDTLRDVIVRLEGFDVDAEVVDHFRSLLPPD